MAKAELIYLATQSGLVTLSNPGGIGRWLKAGTSMQAQPLCCVWSNPQDPTHVICGDGHQLWQSHDGAQQWQPMAGPACRVLCASRTSPNRILAGDGVSAWLSHDAGVTWHALGHAQHVGMAGETLWYDQMQSSDGGQRWQTISATIAALSYDAKSRLMRDADGTWVQIRRRLLRHRCPASRGRCVVAPRGRRSVPMATCYGTTTMHNGCLNHTYPCTWYTPRSTTLTSCGRAVNVATSG